MHFDDLDGLRAQRKEAYVALVQVLSHWHIALTPPPFDRICQKLAELGWKPELDFLDGYFNYGPGLDSLPEVRKAQALTPRSVYPFSSCLYLT